MIADHPRIHSSASNAWYTPPLYLDAVREVLGAIDLDPASDAIGNRTAQAADYYTEADDGLTLPWCGSVFCNPPSGRLNGRSNQVRWTQKAIAEYRAGNVHEMIVHGNAQTAEQWFQPALDPYPIGFPRGRIAFLDDSGTAQPSPTHGTAFIYFGPESALFIAVFGPFGRCTLAWPSGRAYDV